MFYLLKTPKLMKSMKVSKNFVHLKIDCSRIMIPIILMGKGSKWKVLRELSYKGWILSQDDESLDIFVL